MPGYIWAEDKEHCEEYGRMAQADPAKVSMRAKKRGLPQVSCNFMIVTKTNCTCHVFKTVLKRTEERVLAFLVKKFVYSMEQQRLYGHCFGQKYIY